MLSSVRSYLILNCFSKKLLRERYIILFKMASVFVYKILPKTFDQISPWLFIFEVVYKKEENLEKGNNLLENFL